MNNNKSFIVPPQESNQPYLAEEVVYDNKTACVKLAGTLTLPYSKGPFPAVLLISGWGKNDRDYTMLDHKLFLVLADYLTRQGIAVLRVDKRGVGKSTGTFDATLTSEDFASDVFAGVAYLKTRQEINSRHIGLIGHSEGGLIAPMVAVQLPDISFLVLMAGVATTDIDNIVEHIAMQLRADGASKEVIELDKKIRRELLVIVKQEKNCEIAESQLRRSIEKYLNRLSKDQKNAIDQFLFTIKQANVDAIIAMFNSPWYRYLLNYDPTIALKKIKVPVLAINGDCDFITSSRITLPVIEQALKLASNHDYTILKIPKLNHRFQTCMQGSMIEYGTIEETIAPLVLRTIANWILERVSDN